MFMVIINKWWDSEFFILHFFKEAVLFLWLGKTIKVIKRSILIVSKGLFSESQAPAVRLSLGLSEVLP